MFFFSILSIFHSNAPWKAGYSMNDPDYLPVPPLFMIVKPDPSHPEIFGDYLSINQDNTGFVSRSVLRDLNKRKDVNKSMETLKHACNNRTAQACIVLGRIYEFGAYGQKESRARALNYYQRALELGDRAALVPLSFFHRYYSVDIPRSVLEADSTDEYVESLLATSVQHEKGFLRPSTCPGAAEKVLRVAQLAAAMNMFHHSKAVNETEAARLRNSTDPKDMYTLGMSMANVPYPSKDELKRARELLMKAYNMGNYHAAAPIIRIDVVLQPQQNFTYILDFLDKALKINDPDAMLLAHELTSVNQVTVEQSYMYIKDAAQSGYPPAVHRMGELTYWGLLKIPRSNKEGFKIFMKAAATGYRPSMFWAARQLLGGDGADVNCMESLSMLRRIVDLGPWSTFLDKYVKRGSKHAFLKMLDMNLTPIRLMKIQPETETIEKLVNTSLLAASELSTKSSVVIDKLRLAREGDYLSILWLVLNSNLADALQWLQRIESMPPRIAFLSKPLHTYLILKNLKYRSEGKLSQKEIQLLKECSQPYITFFLIVFTTITLLFAVSTRIKLFFLNA